MAIISTQNFKDYRGITASTWDTLIGTLITNAQAQAERYCRRTFDTATFTETYDGSGAGVLILRNAPITSITSVSALSRNSDGTETASALSAGTYRFDADSGELFLVPRGLVKSFAFDSLGSPSPTWSRGASFTEGFQNYRVVYVGGYGGSYSMPADLKQAMYEMVDELFTPIYLGQGDSKQYQSETLGDYSYSRKAPEEYSALWKARLEPFRRAIP